MRCAIGMVTLVLSGVIGIGSAMADRPIEPREKADIVVTGTVTAVYENESEGYRSYIIEVSVEEAEKGKDIKRGDTFRAACYQRKAGKGGLEFDTSGHTTVPKEGQRVKMFVLGSRGRNDGVYPDWVEVLPPKAKQAAKKR